MAPPTRRKQRCDCGCNQELHPGSISRHRQGKAALAIRASLASTRPQIPAQDGSQPVKRACIRSTGWVPPLERVRFQAGSSGDHDSHPAQDDHSAEGAGRSGSKTGVSQPQGMAESITSSPVDAVVSVEGHLSDPAHFSGKFNRISGFACYYLRLGFLSLSMYDPKPRLEDSEPQRAEEARRNHDEEEIWAGFGHGRRQVTVEEDEDEEDDFVPGGTLSDDEDRILEEISADDDTEDEFDPISVWDELSEALFRAAGSNGA